MLSSVILLMNEVKDSVNKRLKKTGRFKSRTFKLSRFAESVDPFYSFAASIDDSFYGRAIGIEWKVQVIVYTESPDTVYVDIEDVSVEDTSKVYADYKNNPICVESAKFSLLNPNFDTELGDFMFRSCITIVDGIKKWNDEYDRESRWP